MAPSGDEHDGIDDNAAEAAARRQEIAARVRYWMNRRGMTRTVFAGRLGKSTSWADKIKRGDRQLDRLSVLRQIAHVLGVPLGVLIDADAAEQARTCTDATEIAAIQEALERYDGLTGAIPDAEPNLAKLRQNLHYGWHAFQSSGYQVASRLLPDLLVALQLSYRSLDGDDRYRAAELLTQAYWLAAAISFKLGRPDLCWLAADRGIQVAEWTGNLTLIGRTSAYVVKAMAAGTDDGARRALAMARATADRLETSAAPEPQQLSACGMLLLEGSMAAATLNDAAASRDLNVDAAHVATRLGADRNDHWSAFGPTNVAVWRVCALANLHEAGRVVDAADTITEGQLRAMPRERRATHLTDVARGYSQWGKRDQAVELLIEADHLAREEVRCRPHTRTLIAELIESYPGGTKPSTALAALARAVRMTV